MERGILAMYCETRDGALGADGPRPAKLEKRSSLPPLTSTLADLVSDGVLLIDPCSLTILDANRSFAQKVAQPRESLIGRELSSLMRSMDAGQLSQPNSATGDLDSECGFVAELIQQNGATQPVAVSMCTKEAEGQSVLVLAVRSAHDGDLDDQKLRRFLAAAQADPLTGLPNRDRLQEQLDREPSPEAAVQQMMAVLFIDVDHFKSINDRLGHTAGDSVLREVADRLRDSVRPSDFVGRFGGDEFVVIANDINGREDATLLAHRICHELRQPILLRDCTEREIHVTVSIGVAVSVEDAQRKRDELVAQADREMYRAKAAGRDRFSLRTQSSRN